MSCQPHDIGYTKGHVWHGKGRGKSRSRMAQWGERERERDMLRKSEERALHVKAAHHKANGYRVDRLLRRARRPVFDGQ